MAIASIFGLERLMYSLIRIFRSIHCILFEPIAALISHYFKIAIRFFHAFKINLVF